MEWWQHLPEHINPVIFKIGDFGIRWYSLGYIVAFILVYFVSRWRLRHEEKYKIYTEKHLEDVFMYIVLGVVLGARLGYCVFYEPAYYLPRPWLIFLPFSLDNGLKITGISGMSYHGGVIGVLVSILIFTKRYKIDFFKFMDLLVPSIPIAYTFGRLGNFMNGELYGRVTEVPWGMHFYKWVRTADGKIVKDVFNHLRHPSQLYEAFGEGILLFLVIWLIRKHVKTDGVLGAIYLIGYGIIRFIIEFFRKPDDIFLDQGQTIGTVIGIFSMGQILCIAMILGGILYIKISEAHARKQKTS